MDFVLLDRMRNARPGFVRRLQQSGLVGCWNAGVRDFYAREPLLLPAAEWPIEHNVYGGRVEAFAEASTSFGWSIGLSITEARSRRGKGLGWVLGWL